MFFLKEVEDLQEMNKEENLLVSDINERKEGMSEGELGCVCG